MCTDTKPGDAKPAKLVTGFPTPGRDTMISGFDWSKTRFERDTHAPGNLSVASKASTRPRGVKRTGYCFCAIGMSVRIQFGRTQRTIHVESLRVEANLLHDLLFVSFHDEMHHQELVAIVLESLVARIVGRLHEAHRGRGDEIVLIREPWHGRGQFRRRYVRHLHHVAVRE